MSSLKTHSLPIQNLIYFSTELFQYGCRCLISQLLMEWNYAKLFNNSSAVNPIMNHKKTIL